MKINSVRIETVSPKLMAYRTVGDWGITGTHLWIKIADTGNWSYNMLVAVHELVEALLCAYLGISESRVTKFDLAHQGDDDPGSHPKAPYHDQHMVAMGIEMILSVALGIKWRPYEKVLDRTSMKAPLGKK